MKKMLLPEERGENEANELLPDSDEELPEQSVAYTPTAEQLRDLKIAHDNAGHPDNSDFARMLRLGRARPEVAAWVRKHFKC